MAISLTYVHAMASKGNDGWTHRYHAYDSCSYNPGPKRKKREVQPKLSQAAKEQIARVKRQIELELLV